MPRHPWAVTLALRGTTYFAVPGYTLIADQGSQTANEALVESVEQLVDETGRGTTAPAGSAVVRVGMIRN